MFIDFPFIKKNAETRGTGLWVRGWQVGALYKQRFDLEPKFSFLKKFHTTFFHKVKIQHFLLDEKLYKCQEMII